MRLVAALFVLAAAAAQAQSWPAKPVILMVAAAAGSSVDIPARLVAERLDKRIGQPVVVENRPQAGGTIAANQVAKAAPDGHTLLWAFNGPIANAPYLYSKLPYDPQKDLVPVVQTTGQPFVLGVPASLGVGSVKELVERIRANPGKLNYSSLGNGSGTHLTMELLKSQAKLFLVHIPYNGGPPAAAAVATGEVHASFMPMALFLPHVNAGRVKLLAVSGARRWDMLPELPTIAESGFPGFDSDGWNGILAPAGTPREIVTRLNREVNEILQLPEVKERLARSRIRIDGGSSERFAELIRRDAERWSAVIRAVGAKLD
ncbi:MAG: Bug family tripartite tricarboxylate transporter substrate binding protein [Betaproteobacteria bacterium]